MHYVWKFLRLAAFASIGVALSPLLFRFVELIPPGMFFRPSLSAFFVGSLFYLALGAIGFLWAFKKHNGDFMALTAAFVLSYAWFTVYFGHFFLTGGTP